MKRLLLFGKGFCVGFVDVVPGVSGGTIALILGIYVELVNTIKNLNLRWIGPVWRWLTQGRKPEDRAALLREFEALNLGFLLVLAAGIVSAIIFGSMVIPPLIDRYPEAMRGLFFGLILASVIVPLGMIPFRGASTRVLVAVMAVLGGGMGYFLSNPSHTFDTATSWTVVESRGESLQALARRGPSAWTTEAVYWAPQNEALRRTMAETYPERAAELDRSYVSLDSETVDKEALKARSAPYDDLEVPDGVPVEIPRPTLWFVFLAGFIAICAMILPGVSGSYILLILGAYFFILNALKGVVQGLARGELPLSAGVFVVVFCIGCGLGLLSAARLISFLLRRFPAPTLGLLIGLMVGCLRGIWPFQELVAGAAVNVIPTAVDGTVISVAATCVAGALLVFTLTWMGRSREEEQAARSEYS